MQLPPIDVTHLFPVLDEMLVAFLKILSPAQWQMPTLAKQWTVKDVAAHLLDGNIRAIAMEQGHELPPATNPITDYASLVAHLNDLNASWVGAMKRVSPAQLIEWLQETGKQYSAIMAKRPMFAAAPFGVAWAGEEQSLNWFHVAREYTEKMHHQLQIRHAFGAEADLLTAALFNPFISTLMYGLPHALRNISGPFMGYVKIEVTGYGGGTWFAEKQTDNWQLVNNPDGEILASVKLTAAAAWKLFTKGAKPAELQTAIRVDGDSSIYEAVLNMIAVMA